jgi:hypothetical protein
MLAVATLVAAGSARRAVACDICAIYTATEQREGRTPFSLGVAEQYSNFATELLNGQEVTLPATEHMGSSVTQFLLRWSPSRRFGVQLNIPYIHRSFTRIRRHQLESGIVQGAGDMALVGDFLAFDTIRGDSLFRFSLLGGLKFPTGNPDFLAEEFVAAPATAVTAGVRRGVAQPQILPLEGGLHGHDLTLGSGSWDGIVGGQLYWSWSRLFVTAGMQYAVRSTGAFDYRFANDLTWVGGPGWYALLTHETSLGLRVVLSGETKGKDEQQGRSLGDTALTALYVGPGVSFTWESALSAELTADLPVIQHNTGLQLVPNVRVRGGLVWHF